MIESTPASRYAAVAVAVPVRRLFTYRVPDEPPATFGRGSRVIVPFGRRRIVGTVIEWPAAEPAPDVEVKRIDAVLPGTDPLPPPLLELTRFVAEYYLCSWGEAIEAALPPEAPRLRGPAFVRRRPGARPEDLPPRARARRALLSRLPADGTPSPWGQLRDAERRLVRALAQEGWVEIVTGPAGGPVASVGAAEPALPPTAAQAAALARIEPAVRSDAFRPYLLYGATGSGKTEVYLQAAAAALERGRGALYLVPEIGLTPLLLDKIARRFPGRVALMHSARSAAERRADWERVLRGERRFVLGTRSAVFAPLGNPGLIVVDEEQDGSYKQEESPRYNARDLAVVRAQAEGATLILGSATPSMESFHRASSGRYELLRLGGRIQERPLPEVTLVDMRREYERSGEVRPLSGELCRRLRECVERGEQAIVLRNRRGWATSLLCPRCGRRVECGNCSVALTWHRAEALLRCHHCGSARALPAECPSCGSRELKLLGEGSERIEELVREALPGARVERMDRDRVRRRGEQELLLRRFDRGEIQVLVGTQMVAKGHDFPRVTLVGVLSADHSLGLPDFRAGERVFQLLTQVAGRAGRGERPGSVVIQAFDPEHPLLLQAARQDYEAFYERELGYRRALRYPPLGGLVQFIVHDRSEARAREWAEIVGSVLRSESEERLVVSGPSPAPLERLRGRHRQQLLVRSAGRRRLIRAVERCLVRIAGEVPRRALTVDVDPYSLS